MSPAESRGERALGADPRRGQGPDCMGPWDHREGLVTGGAGGFEGERAAEEAEQSLSRS